MPVSIAHYFHVELDVEHLVYVRKAISFDLHYDGSCVTSEQCSDFLIDFLKLILWIE